MVVELLASAAIAAITPFLIKGGEALAEGVGKDLWELIKKPFKSPDEKAIVKQLEEKPNDRTSQNDAIKKLDELLRAYPDIARQIESLLEKNPSLNIQNIKGNGNISFQDIKGGNVTINR